MTEKRFKIADYPTDIEDTQTGEKYPCSSYYTHMEIICDLLNELNNENEQLKARIEHFERKIQRERVSAIKQDEKWQTEALEKIKGLEKENERLKKENKDLEAFRYNVFKSMDKARIWREKKLKARKNF